MHRPIAAGLCALALAHPAVAAAQSDEALWLGGGMLVAGALLLDRTVDRSLPDGGGERLEWATRGLNFGGRPQVAVPALGAVWAAGHLAGEPGLSRSAARIGGGLLAAGVANGTVKFALGRERPTDTDDPLRLRPFNPDNRWQAFPSGHATVAFSLATGIAEEADRPWVTVLVYSGAALVAWSRVYDDKHWTSDVAGGALIGVGVTRATIRAMTRSRSAPVLQALPGGVALAIPF